MARGLVLCDAQVSVWSVWNFSKSLVRSTPLVEDSSPTGTAERMLRSGGVQEHWGMEAVRVLTSVRHGC